jgi:S1-C subfamily serine protease
MFWLQTPAGPPTGPAKILRVILLLSGFMLIAANTTHGQGQTAVKVDGTEWQNIRRVEQKADGRVMILTDGGGGMVALDKLPQDFLESWGINSEKAKQDAFETALKSGKFRRVGSTVYDLRKEQPSWQTHKQARVIKRIGLGEAMLDLTPDSRNYTFVHVRNLPLVNRVADTDRFEFTAMLTGTFELIGPNNRLINIRSYDAGVACDRTQIPDGILKDGNASARIGGTEQKTYPMESLPDRENIVSSGTGFCISEEGYLITNDHVVRGANRIKVRVNKQTLEAECIKSDQAKDLALLKVSGNWPGQSLKIYKVGSPKLGEEVFTIGFPNTTIQGLQPKYTDGKISSLSGLRDDAETYQISVPVQPGNSGGPLVMTDGRVAGVVVGSLNSMASIVRMGSVPQNVNYAIKVQTVRDFLIAANLPVKVMTAAPVEKITREDAVKLAEASVCQIICYK